MDKKIKFTNKIQIINIKMTEFNIRNFEIAFHRRPGVC